jgi:sialate O-acetylesterase
MSLIPRCFALGLIGGFLAVTAKSDIWLGPLFSDGAVLQQGRPVPIWGSGVPGEKVEVSFAGQTVTTTVNDTWRWMAVLKPLAASSEPRDLVVQGKNKEVRHNVVVGEVWLCAGQSNIEWPVRLSTGGDKAAAAGNLPLIRHFKVPRATAAIPREDFQASWTVATPDSVPHFSGVGFFFGRELHEKLKVPIGLVNCTFGGTPVEAWLPPSTLAGSEAGRAALSRWEKRVADWPSAVAKFQESLPAALDRAAEMPTKPNVPAEYDVPSGAYLGMLYPLFPYSVRGVIWYQGESNVGRDEDYRVLFPTFVKTVRTLWGVEELPFYFVQIPNYEDPNDRGGTKWAELRDAQTSALALPNTDMAVAIDGDEPENLHPRNSKQPVGHRLALLAEHHLYGLEGEYSGPRVEKAARDGAAVRIQFSHAKGGLKLTGPDQETFELAGADQVYHRADARVDGSTLVLNSAEVKEPAFARYAWRNAPKAALFNQEELPAAPFRVALSR